MTMKAIRAGIWGLALGLGVGLWSAGLAAATMPHSSLSATKDSGVPPGISSQWMAARGDAKVVAREGGQDVVEFEARNLVPDGLYTFWWVNKESSGMDMGPGGGAPDNEFRADAKGSATAEITVPSTNDYQTMIVAYHADNRTHGESPGDMGKTTFNHLMGSRPGPAGEASK